MTDGAVYGIKIVDSGSARGTRIMPDDVDFRQRGRTRNARHENTVSSGPASVIFGRVDARYSGWLSLPTDRTC
jgi:hypothetical protein